MSKRDEVYELFTQGRKPEAPCVQELGLKPETLKRYYREWGQGKQIVKSAPPVGLPEGKEFLSSLRSGAKYEYRGRDYRKAELLDGGNIAGIEIRGQKRLVFRANTIVIPK